MKGKNLEPNEKFQTNVLQLSQSATRIIQNLIETPSFSGIRLVELAAKTAINPNAIIQMFAKKNMKYSTHSKLNLFALKQMKPGIASGKIPNILYERTGRKKGIKRPHAMVISTPM